MSEKVYTVKNFAKLTGVTERTLRYYDRKGLLTPSSYTKEGHRLYCYEDLYKMQKILTLKYLGFSLAEIFNYINENAKTSTQELLHKQKQLLIKKRDEMDHVIYTISRVEVSLQNEEIDSNLLLAIIHSIQNEEQQKNWLSQHVSIEVVEQAFMEHLAVEERQAIEQETLNSLKKLQILYEQGYAPSKAEVQEIIAQLVECRNSVMSPQYIEEIEKMEIDEDFFIHFTFMTKEIQEYIEEAVVIFHELNREQS